MASTRQQNARKGMPTWNATYDYWSKQTKIARVKPELQSRWDVSTCMACGGKYPEKFRLERAHIFPLWLGGGNEIENIHILCPVCHKDSEMMWRRGDKPEDGIARYWGWFFYRTEKHAAFSRCRRLGDSKFWNTDSEFLNELVDCYRHDTPLLEKCYSAAFECDVKFLPGGVISLERSSDVK